MAKIYSLVLLVSNCLLFGQNHFIDTSFGENSGFTITDYENKHTMMPTNVVEDQDAIYINAYDFSEVSYLFKYDKNGILHKDFGINGAVKINDKGRPINSLGSSTGSLYKIGNKLEIINNAAPKDYSPEYLPMITQLNLSDGSINNNYGTNGQYLPSLINGIQILGSELLTNSDVIVVGYNTYNTTSNPEQQIIITKINSNGTRSVDFGNNGVLNFDYDHNNYEPVKAIIKDDNVYILLSNYSTDAYVVKFNLISETLDNSFGDNGKLAVTNFKNSESVESIQTFFVDTNNEIYISGSVQINGSLLYEFLVAKYVNNKLDPNFGQNGIFKTKLRHDVNASTKSYTLKRHANKLLIMGTYSPWNSPTSFEKAFLTQLNLNGTQDNDFGQDGTIINELFDYENIPYDYLYAQDHIITIGTCGTENHSQMQCLVKYNKSANLNTVNPQKQDKLIIYPNPVVDIMSFKSHNISKIEVYDLTGKLINVLPVTKNKVNLNTLKTGRYYIKAYNGEKTLGINIIKQ